MKRNIKKGRYLFYEGEVYDLGSGDEAMAKAEEALAAAQAAQQTADDAQTAADSAQATADEALANGLPDGGTAGQVVTKTADGAEWADIPGLDLLWTNASPGSNFVGQTISLDLSNAKEVWIMYRARKDSVAYSWYKLTVDGGSYAYLPPIFYSGKAVERQTFAYTYGVVFQAGRYFNTYGGSRTDDNSYMIPIRIAVRR